MTAALLKILWGTRTSVNTPDGWMALDPTDFAPLLPAAGDRPTGDIDLVAVLATWRGPFTPNLEILTAPVATGVAPADWDAAGLAALSADVPGFRLIDSFRWDNGNWIGTMRMGVYIAETTSVTACQWSWLDEMAGIGVTATALCPTRHCQEFYPLFCRMARTVEVDHGRSH